MGAIIPLLCPAIIFGGILSGAATATEISVVAVVYAFVVGVFIYGEIKWSDLVPMLSNTVKTTGAVMFLVGFASVLSWIFATNQIPQLVAGWVTKISTSPFVFLILSNVCFILLGAMLEGVPAMLILVPIFLPVVTQLGIDPLHFGILVVASLGIGLFLPPVGMGIFIACTFAEIDVGSVFRSFAPFLVALFAGLTDRHGGAVAHARPADICSSSESVERRSMRQDSLGMLIRFFASIRNITGVKEIEWAEPTPTLGELLRLLSDRYGPEFRRWVLDGENLGGSVMVVINGDDARHQGGCETRLGSTDVVSILPIMAGGTASIQRSAVSKNA